MNDVAASTRMTEVDYDPFASPELARAVPTTEAQRELWLADQLGREASLAYNESVTIAIEGALDLPALQNALLALADRHEALRATLSADGMNMLIAPRGNLLAQVIDLAAKPEAEQAASVAQLCAEAVETHFDVTNGPLMRATLVRLGDRSHRLLVTGHHVVCDGWSFGVLSTELMQLYAGIVGSTSATLPFAESFGDYALAQLDAEHARQAEADTRYWVSVYDQSVPVLELPADRSRPAQRSFESRREDLRLPAELVDKVRKCGAKQGASLFATMFALFAGLMARLSGQDDVVVGVPAAGQSADGKETLVGHCLNLLPVRVACDLKLGIDELVKTARTQVLDAYDHQHCTFGSLLKKLQLDRDPSRLPLVSVLFNIDSAIRSEDLSVAGLKVDLHSNPRHFENFELFLNASQFGGEIVLELQYNTGLFERATVQRWMALYRIALERLVANSKLSGLEVFAPSADESALLASFNQTAAEYPRGTRVESLVATQAARTPQATAVVCASGQFSYLELEQRANALANELVRLGAGPGRLVGLACARNQYLLVGMLGILKTGAGYVPLDPSFPADRLAHMRSDAGLALIVSDASVAASLERSEAHIVLADSVGTAPDGPPAGSDTASPAYVIYTSGSTGKPKGVAVPQGAVVNFLTSMARKPGLAPHDRLVAVTTPSFDIAVLELLLPLTLGAQVILASRDEVMDGPALRALMERHDATAMQATPSGWRLLLESGWEGRGDFKALIGGEPLPPDLAQALLQRTGELWNMYGPTETTVWSTCWQVPRAARWISIGTPIDNTTVQVLDDQMRPCPLGVAGEIVIGGDGVAIGYLHRPELTAEKFIEDPQHPGRRLYRTGDLGRWRAEGLIEHLGRLDFQVKVRGYRIELGEIEANLVRHASVDRCVVITREDQPGDVRLVAYVVPKNGTVDAAGLRDFLRSSLPEYMIPQHVVELAAIPLLPNGKINRKGLPKPEGEAVAAASRLAARNPLEQQVLSIMEQVLNLPGLGVRDSFFAMGGHSLLAAKLNARINKEFQLGLPLRAVFESPTVEALALAVDKARGSNAPRRQAIEHQADQSIAPLTVMQERIRFMEEMQPGRVLYNTPSAHRLTGSMDVAAFGRAFAQLLRRQPSLRGVIESAADGQGHLFKVQDNVDASIPFEDLSALAEPEREAEVLRRMQAIIDTPLDIKKAPLFRVALYRMAPQQHVFFFMPHHIIWDGWSFDLLYQEMSALYPAALENRSPTLSAPPVSYVDFAHWHAAWMQGDECRAQLQFWKDRYAGIDTPRPMPTDRPRSAGMTGTGAAEWVHVDKALTERLRDVARGQDATLNMLVTAVYAAMLSQTLGSRSIAMGIPVRARVSGEVESVMGFFNNLLPTHLDVDPARSLGDWVARVKRELMDYFANQEVPFERLATEPEIARHANKAGLYQSLFSFQDARDRERAWGPLKHQSVLVMQKGATEDFGLWLMEVPLGLEGGFNYNADLFDAATAQLFRERLIGLLQRVAATPALTIAQLLEAPGEDTTRFLAWVQSRHASRDAAEVDRAAARPARPAAAARGALSGGETKLAEIWARLLGVDAAMITREDNFFDIGGSSLLAMQAVAEAEKSLGLKVDARRYAYEPLGSLAAAAGASAPVNELQARLATLWANLLGIDAAQIRGDDNFFDLGGSSLLAMRAVADAERDLGLKIDPRRFAFETLSQLAVPAATPAVAAAVVTAAPGKDEKAAVESGGLFSRVLGRLGRRP